MMTSDIKYSTSPWYPTAFSTYAVILVVLAILFNAYRKRRALVDRCNRVPGPDTLPLFGNALALLRDPDDVFPYMIDYLAKWSQTQPILRFWAGPFPVFIVYTAEAAEVLLGSNKLIDKCREYEYLHPWLSTGLLTSTGGKWYTRRKMLTPAFHFKILEDFVDIFNEQSRIFVEKLAEAQEQHGPKGFNIFPYAARCTLDIICDTAMGRRVNAQSQENSEYVEAVNTISRIVQTRQVRPWLQPSALFNFTSMSRTQSNCLRILHTFTDRVIQERKIERKNLRSRAADGSKQHDQTEDLNLNKKQRLAFLDLLIDASKGGELMNDQDIREEVDTFMFEGHDTTSAGVSWCLHLIGSHPEVQEKVLEELDRVFGDSDRYVTMSDMSNLKYLECCIKEALRLFPSVPMIGRTISEDTEFR